MSKLVRILRNMLFGLLAVATLAWGAVYAMSERILRRHYEVAPTAVAVPDDPAAIERGRHLALTRGCTGCHGEQLQGGVFFEEAHVARLVAPSVAKLVRERPVESLERSIRHGVRPEGATVRGMPSEMYSELMDADLGALLAYARSLPVVERALPETEVRVLGRIGLATGKYVLAAQWLETSPARRYTVDPGDPVSLGRYLARTSCTECHGRDLRGDAGGPEPSPNLALVASYTPEQFARLMREGVPAGGQKLGLMGAVAKGRCAYFTDEEIAALYQYLRLLADPSAADRL
jgi:mono/diheme cytochrome c family protein